MTKYSFFFILLAFSHSLFAQNKADYFKVQLEQSAEMPDWAATMYSADPDVFLVDSLYSLYYQQNSFQKNIHTQNYKYWRRQISTIVDKTGHIRPLSTMEEDRLYQDLSNRWLSNQQQTGIRNFSAWNCIGPFETYTISTGATRSTQVNIYAMAQAPSNPNTLYAGTEGNGVYKSIDKGLSWNYMTAPLNIRSVTGIEVDPNNADIVYFAANNRIFKTIDGGLNWTELYNAGGSIYEFLIDPSNSQKIMAVGNIGLIKSIDGGVSWTSQYTANCWDIDYKPGSTDTIYLLKNNSAAKIDELYRSDDGGNTWTLKNSGYYIPTVFAEASAIGGKIAVSPAAPELVYVALIGNSKAGDDGWIGLFRSTNMGDNWTNPSGQTGGPYSAQNPYMVGYSSGYHQGFYNFDLEVSDINPAKIWIASIFLYTSADSGSTFQQISPHPHADHQDMDVNGTDIWIATDGGLDLSTDELQTFQSRKNGITGSEYWRIGSGWNEDIIVGGRYHNGDAALFMPNYGAGQSLFLGAAEQGTGYVHPLNNRQSYFSDLGSSPVIPTTLTGAVEYLPQLSLFPNEGYTLRRSELVFDCRYANILYLGKDNQFWKSTDGGVNFTAMQSFGSSTSKVLEIEQSRSQPNIMYCSVFNEANSTSLKGEIYKSVDGGNSWTKTTDLPATYRRELQLTINPENSNEIWVGNTYGNNGQKVYSSSDGGMSWQNRSTNTLDGEDMRDILYQPAPTNDLVYVATYYGVFYWDATISDWVNMSNGLPYILNTNEMQPFFRDAKLRIGTFGRAIWEAEMAADVRPIAQPITQQDTLYCGRDTVQFDCYSIFNHSGGSWHWTFSPAPLYLSDSLARNPKVVFGTSGSYDVTLSIVDGQGRTSSKTIANMVTVIPSCEADSIPGQALSCVDANDYGQTSAFDLTTNVLTISAWIKPDGLQLDYTGIVMSDGSNAAGFNFREGNNTLGYHWPGGQWWWDSNLEVPSGQWSHVAMVANGNSMTLYLNGKAAVHNIALTATDISALKIGSYRGWIGRNFNGLIDEVCIWDRALTQNEVRAMRHLTKEDIVSTDPNLIAYYQFNENQNSQVTDKVGIHHLTLANGALLTASTAPVGGGVSESLTITSSGAYNYPMVGMQLSIGSNIPNGEVFASRINLQPDSIPNSSFIGLSEYWILNNYGSNNLFDIDSFQLYPTSAAIIGNTALTSLYHRSIENAFLNNWQGPCTPSSANLAGFYSFNSSCSIAQSGQFYLMSDNNPVALAPVTATSSIELYPNPAQSGQQIFIRGDKNTVVRFQLFDSQGKLVLAQFIRLESNLGSYVRIPSLSAGHYFYSLQSNSYIQSGKLVIEE